MIVGVLTVDVAVLDARSLKDKRRVILSLKQRLQNSFNVSVAEVGHQDAHKRCLLAMAMVSQDTRSMHSKFDKMVDLVRRMKGLSLVDYERTIY